MHQEQVAPPSIRACTTFYGQFPFLLIEHPCDAQQHSLLSLCTHVICLKYTYKVCISIQLFFFFHYRCQRVAYVFSMQQLYLMKLWIVGSTPNNRKCETGVYLFLFLGGQGQGGDTRILAGQGVCTTRMGRNLQKIVFYFAQIVL